MVPAKSCGVQSGRAARACRCRHPVRYRVRPVRTVRWQAPTAASRPRSTAARFRTDRGRRSGRRPIAGHEALPSTVAGRAVASRSAAIAARTLASPVSGTASRRPARARPGGGRTLPIQRRGVADALHQRGPGAVQKPLQLGPPRTVVIGGQLLRRHVAPGPHRLRRSAVPSRGQDARLADPEALDYSRAPAVPGGR